MTVINEEKQVEKPLFSYNAKNCLIYFTNIAINSQTTTKTKMLSKYILDIKAVSRQR